jgi:hypothetical protein
VTSARHVMRYVVVLRWRKSMIPWWVGEQTTAEYG